MSQAAAFMRIFGECREAQIPCPLGFKPQARLCPVACYRVFDFHSGYTLHLSGVDIYSAPEFFIL